MNYITMNEIFRNINYLFSSLFPFVLRQRKVAKLLNLPKRCITTYTYIYFVNILNFARPLCQKVLAVEVHLYPKILTQ